MKRQLLMSAPTGAEAQSSDSSPKLSRRSAVNNGRILSLTLCVALCVVALAALLLVMGDPARAEGSTRYVATTGADSGDCTNPSNPCQTVQYAVDRAASDDVIKVASGVYTGVEGRPVPPGYSNPPASGIIKQMLCISKTVTIRGGYTFPGFTDPPAPPGNPTTLDAEKQGRVLCIRGSISPTIEGLRITGGNATGLGGAMSGSDAGGGIYVITATALIISNHMFGNVAELGGGLYLLDGSAIVERNTISGNTADLGAGAYLEHSTKVVFSRNAITGNIAASIGGGLALGYSDATLHGNTIRGNMANTFGGGALAFTNSEARLMNDVFFDNQTIYGGSALFAVGGSSVSMLHETIAHNAGGDGSGIHLNTSSIVMTNTILVSHTVGIYAGYESTAMLTATLWANDTNWAGTGTIVTGTVNVWGDPAFVDPDAGDYHIGPASAALDEGVDAGVTRDIDLQPRPHLAPDLGADEYWPPCVLNECIYLPLVVRQSP
jgi:hypothetical protein